MNLGTFRLLGSLMVVSMLAPSMVPSAFAQEPVPPPPQIDQQQESSFGPGSGSLQHAIAFFQKRVNRSDRDFISRSILGSLYFRHAREYGDGEDYDRAEDVLRVALAINPDYQPSRLGLAAVLSAHHQFDQARALVRGVVEKEPGNQQALALLGDVELAIGNYEQAEHLYRKLDQRLAAVLARLARIEELHARHRAAVELLTSAVEQAQIAKATTRELAWYQIRLGELHWSLGRYDQAAIFLEEVLARIPDSVDAIRRLAQVRGAQNRGDEAEALYRRALELDGDPTIYADLGDLYQSQGETEKAAQCYHEAEHLWEHMQEGGFGHHLGDRHHDHSRRYPGIESRALARFLCDQDRRTEYALRLAREDLEMRHDILAYDTLAWALYRNRRNEEAMTAVEKALRLGTQNAEVLFHAGLIAARSGDSEQAKKYLTGAMETNPSFSLRHRATLVQTLQKTLQK